MTMQSRMNSVTHFITQVGPHLLPAAAVLFSVIGLHERGLSIAQIGALTTVLVIFTGLLSESLKTVVELRSKQPVRATVVATLGVGLAALEIVLVHEGMVWAFNGIMAGWTLWAASVFFTMLNVFAKFGFIDAEVKSEVKKQKAPIELDIASTYAGLKQVNDLFDKVA